MIGDYDLELGGRRIFVETERDMEQQDFQREVQNADAQFSLHVDDWPAEGKPGSAYIALHIPGGHLTAVVPEAFIRLIRDACDEFLNECEKGAK